MEKKKKKVAMGTAAAATAAAAGVGSRLGDDAEINQEPIAEVIAEPDDTIIDGEVLPEITITGSASTVNEEGKQDIAENGAEADLSTDTEESVSQESAEMDSSIVENETESGGDTEDVAVESVVDSIEDTVTEPITGMDNIEGNIADIEQGAEISDVAEASPMMGANEVTLEETVDDPQQDTVSEPEFVDEIDESDEGEGFMAQVEQKLEEISDSLFGRGDTDGGSMSDGTNVDTPDFVNNADTSEF